jgi:uncharacterized protein YjbI with pentapeptide repeats
MKGINVFLILFSLIVSGVTLHLIITKDQTWTIQLPFHVNNEHWENTHYQGLWIADKTLEGIVAKQSQFTDFVFENVVFKNCQFDTVSFERSTFKNVIFENVTFSHPPRPEGKDHLAADEDLSSVRFSDVQFQHCVFNNILMEDSLFEQVTFDTSQLNQVDIDTLGGDISLTNSSGTEVFLIAHGKMNYRQSGGALRTLVMERMNSDFFKVDKATIDHLQVSGIVKQTEISNSHINRFISEIDDGDLLIENCEFNDVNFAFSKTKKVSFLNGKIAEEIQIYKSEIEDLCLMDSRFTLLDLGGKESSIHHADFIRTPFKKIDISKGNIRHMTLKQMALPNQWNISEEGQIDLLEIKQPLFPSSFQYQGKALPQCQVQLGGESQIYTCDL